MTSPYAELKLSNQIRGADWTPETAAQRRKETARRVERVRYRALQTLTKRHADEFSQILARHMALQEGKTSVSARAHTSAWRELAGHYPDEFSELKAIERRALDERRAPLPVDADIEW